MTLPRPKVLLFGLALLALAMFVGRDLLRELASPQERVRFALEDAIDDFNDQELSLMGLFAHDFADETGHDRDDLRGGVMALYWFNGHHYRAELREEQLNIDLDPSGQSAEVALGLAFWEDGDTSGAPWWDLRAVLDLELIDDEWQVVASRDVNHGERGG